jgi:hypothetical protein
MTETPMPPTPAEPPAPLDSMPVDYNVLPTSAPARSRPLLPVVSVAAVLAVVAAALFLAVGRPSGGGALVDAATLVHAASGKATQAGSSDVDIAMTVTVQGHTITATGGGSFDYRRRLGQMHLDMSGMGLGSIGQVQEVMTPKAIYMRMPDALSGSMGMGGRPWFMIRFADFKKFGVDYTKLMNQNGGSDPSSMLRMLSSATGIQRDGTATIDGVRTTKYTAGGSFLDLVRAEGVGSAIDESKLPPGTADTQVHYSVWLDNGGLPRRMQMKMSGGAFAGGVLDMTMTFLHYGTKVSVTVPPASLVTDMASVLKQSGG